jgi:hypothetical protein
VDRHARNHLGPLIAENRGRHQQKVEAAFASATERLVQYANRHIDRLFALAEPTDPQRRWSGKAMRARHRLMDIALGMERRSTMRSTR